VPGHGSGFGQAFQARLRAAGLSLVELYSSGRRAAGSPELATEEDERHKAVDSV
jgi:hypothetical protein